MANFRLKEFRAHYAAMGKCISDYDDARAAELAQDNPPANASTPRAPAADPASTAHDSATDPAAAAAHADNVDAQRDWNAKMRDGLARFERGGPAAVPVERYLAPRGKADA